MTSLHISVQSSLSTQVTFPWSRSHLVSSQGVYKYVSLDARWGPVSSIMSTIPTDTSSGSSTPDVPPPTQQVSDVRHPTHNFGFLPIPKRLRYDPDKPFYFGTFLNVFFGICNTLGALDFCYIYSYTHGATVCANLYYCQPILSKGDRFRGSVSRLMNKS